MIALLLAAALSGDVTLTACLLDNEPDDAAFSVALREAIGGGTVRLGPGTLILERYPAELRHKTGEPNKRLDITIRGTPGETIICGVGRPHDVLNLNAVSHVTIRDVVITSESVVAGGLVGCNGISLTNGSADVLVDGVTVRSLPFVYRGSNFDGGKCVTVQSNVAAERSTGIMVRNCTFIDTPVAVSIDVAPDKGACPGVIVIDGCKVSNAVAGVAVSFAAHKETVTGFGCEVLNCRFIDVKRPLLVSRGYDVRMARCSVNTAAIPSTPDPYDRLWPSSANVIVQSSRVDVSGNSFVYRVGGTLFDFGAGGNRDVSVEGNVVSR